MFYLFSSVVLETIDSCFSAAALSLHLRLKESDHSFYYINVVLELLSGQPEPNCYHCLWAQVSNPHSALPSFVVQIIFIYCF